MLVGATHSMAGRQQTLRSAGRKALSQKWSTAAYAKALEDAEQEFSQRFDRDNDDPDDYLGDFLDRVGGLCGADYLWILRAGVLRDGSWRRSSELRFRP